MVPDRLGQTQNAASVAGDMAVEREVGYLELLRRNRTFRAYFFANGLSNLGTWFTTIALFVTITELSGKPELGLGIVFVLRMFALALPQPFTGMLADRYSRKWLMVLSNLASAACALAMVSIDHADDLPLLYALSTAMMALHAIYVPAEGAVMPNITSEDELLTANAMNSATWSIALSLGSALGGFAVSAYGVDVAFLLDGVTFVAAAGIIALLDIRQEQPERRGSVLREGTEQIIDGFQRILATPPVARILTAKALWSMFGGGLVYLLVLLGSDIGVGDVAAGIGILFAARGIGTGIGPLIARALFRDRSHWPMLIGLLVSTCGACYLMLALLDWTPWLVLLVTAGHAASGANWVISTVLLQERTEDDWRGRVFGADFLMMTSVNGLSALAASLLIEYGGMDLRGMLLWFAIGQVASGLLWLLLMLPGEKRDAAAGASKSSTTA